MQYLQCFNNGDSAILNQATVIISFSVDLLFLFIYRNCIDRVNPSGSEFFKGNSLHTLPPKSNFATNRSLGAYKN